MKAYIKAIEYYLPEVELWNEDLVKVFPEWSIEKITDKVGIKCRRVASDDETAVDLAVNAAEKLFDVRKDICKEDVDFVILCTQNPDYGLPTSACVIQHRLGLGTSVGAFDYNLGCSGYVYGLAIAKGLITGGIARNILLLTAETYTKRLHPRDKGNRSIFGDAATASLISTEGFAEIGNFALGTDGTGEENLIIRSGGARNPHALNDLRYDDNGNPISSDYLYMNGAEIFSFTQLQVPKLVKSTLEQNNIVMSDVNLCIFHQANKYMLDFLRKKLKIAEDRFFISMENIGNTVSNSIPIAIREADSAAKLHGNVLLAGFGVGYSWGGCILKIS